MSMRSEEMHIHAPHGLVLEHMETYFWQHGGTVVMRAPPENDDERWALAEEPYLESGGETFVVGPTAADGWTVIWGNGWGSGSDLLRYLAEQLQATALYGQYDDQIGTWRWILYEEGHEVAGYWYVGRDDQQWYNYPDRYPKEAMTLWEAFSSRGREYHHVSFRGAVWAAASILGVPHEQVTILTSWAHQDSRHR